MTTENNGLNLAQQNKDFYGYTVFTLKFNDVPIRFVTEKDADKTIKDKEKEMLDDEIKFLESISYQIKMYEDSLQFITIQRKVKERLQKLKGVEE